MNLNKLSLHNFRNFEDIELDFHDKLTLIVGGNGTGKTAILEAAAIALSTFFQEMPVQGQSIKKTDARLVSFHVGSAFDVQPQYPVEIVAEADITEGQAAPLSWKRTLNKESGSNTIKDAAQMTAVSKDYQSRLRSGDETLVLPLIAYYGTGRFLNAEPEKEFVSTQKNMRTNGYVGAVRGGSNVKAMMQWFRKMTVQKYQLQEENMASLPELETVCSAVESCYALVTGFHDVKIRYNLDMDDLDIFYTDEDGMRMSMPLARMSDGYQGTISLIANIAYRMAVLNPQLLGDVLTKTEGVVLIDEIDLHLHPAWQKRILGDLTTIFPKVQFIVTTHAPEVINSVRSESLRILKDGQVYCVEGQVYGKDVKSVLNEIMGVNERPNEVAEWFRQFYGYLDKGNFDKAEEVLAQIEKARDYHDPEAAECRVKLRMEQIRKGGRV